MHVRLYAFLVYTVTDRSRSTESGLHRDARPVGRDVGGLLANGLGTGMRGDCDVDPTGGERRGVVSSLLAGRGVRTLSHLRGIIEYLYLYYYYMYVSRN